MQGTEICGWHLWCEMTCRAIDTDLRLTPSRGGLDRAPPELRQLRLALTDRRVHRRISLQQGYQDSVVRIPPADRCLPGVSGGPRGVGPGSVC
jgi:hypothetical protein